MGKSKCCNAEVINWFGKVNFSLEKQNLQSQLICMKCGQPTEKVDEEKEQPKCES